MNADQIFAKFGVGGPAQQSNSRATALLSLQAKNNAALQPKKGNILTRNLNTGGQIGGGLAGAAAGTAIAPGIGTLIGGLLGAFTGGAGGESAKRAALGEQQNLGESLKQGAIGAGNEAVGQGIAGLLGKIVGRGAETAVEAGGKDVVKAPSLLESLSGKARGVTPGAKVAGQDALGVADSSAVNKYLSDLGLKGSATEQLAKLETHQNGLYSQLDQAIKGGNKAVDDHELTQLVANIQKGLKTGSTTTDLATHPAAQELLSNLIDHGTDTQSLNDFRRTIDANAIKYGANPDASTPAIQQISKIARQNIDKVVADKVPEAKAIQQALAPSYKASDFLTAAAKNPKGIGVSVAGQKIGIPGKLSQSIESRIGALPTSGIGGAAKAAAVAGSPLVARLIPKGVESLASPQQPQAPTSPSDSLAADGTDAGHADQSQATDQSGNIFTPDVLQKLALNDIATTGGKNLNQIATLASLFGPGGKASSGQTLTPAQQKVSDSANAATSTLDTMLEQLNSNGGAQGRVGGAVSGLLGKIGLNDTVSAYNKTKTDAAISLAQALSGSTRVPPPSTLQLLENSMPSYTDNPKEAALKVQNIKQRLQAKLQSSGISQ